MSIYKQLGLSLFIAASSTAVISAVHAESKSQKVSGYYAKHVSHANHAAIMAATAIGDRLIAVGEHGVVLLSNNQGKSWRQAKSVPTQALLTSVYFVNDKNGWIAGHDGVIMYTQDGGEKWTLQHQDLSSDRPLFSIYFINENIGFAVGLFGNALRTTDAGAHWLPFTLTSTGATDRHLYHVFGNADTGLFIAAESGMIYRSMDAGLTWSAIQTSNAGAFWNGLRLSDGSLLVVGQRGHIFSSRDQGNTWIEIPSNTQQSLTHISQLADQSIQVIGLGGVQLHSTDLGKSFSLKERADRIALTTSIPIAGNKSLLFSTSGLVVSP